MYGYECYIQPKPGEILDISVSLPPDGPALVSGQVTEDGQSPSAGALAMLLEQDAGRLLQFAVADENGRFYLGPVEPDRVYTLRVRRDGQTVRTAEISLSI